VKRVVIVGGGPGGGMVANRLVRQMKSEVARNELEIYVVSDTDVHLYQPGLLYLALGLTEPKNIFRKQTDLYLPGVHLVYEAAVKIDLNHRVVKLNSGRELEFDYLVLATGSHPDLDAIPGFREGSHSFYTYEEALKTRKDLMNFKEGKFLMIIGVPHKCPVAPVEFILMYEQLLRQRQLRDKVQLVYTYPLGRLHSLEPCAEWAEGVYDQVGIESEIFYNPETIDAEKQIVYTMEGEETHYDFLMGIPPHKGAPVIRASGIGDIDGWLPTNRYTLQMEGQDGVYVIGDAANLPISKAGSVVHYESDIVVKNLIRELRGEEPLPLYNGKVYCFIEGGLDKATHITFDYNTPPGPAEPTEMVHWFKLAFNKMYWLSVRGLL